MNRKNNRIKAQIVDCLLTKFPNARNWIREMTFENPDWGFEKDEEKEQLKSIIKGHLNKTRTIRLRIPLIGSTGKEFKNDPGIHVDLKLNGNSFSIKWKMAPNFGQHNDVHSLVGMSQALQNCFESLKFIEDLVDLNYQQGDFEHV